MVEINRVTAVFDDAWVLYEDALEELARGKPRNGAEKAWGATKRATDALVLARTGEEVWLSLALGAGAGLVAAGSALFALQREISSWREHIRWRYEGKSYDDLSQRDKARWDHFNKRAKQFLNASFLLLIGEMVGLSVFFGFFLEVF